MRPHLLVTNDFPPKHGGIQTYLWELWRRLPPEGVTVLTTPFEGAAEWDATQPYRIVRTPEKVLLPMPSLRRRVRALAEEVGAELVLFDPAVPVGLLGLARDLGLPYGLLLHGAELVVPAKVPGLGTSVKKLLRGAELIVTSGAYVYAEAERIAGRSLPGAVVLPGIDLARFQPLDPDARRAVRAAHGLDPDGVLVLGLSRLVKRKGFDVVIEAAARLSSTHPGLQVAIGGSGRDRPRLEAIAAKLDAPVKFLGRVPDEDLPGLYAAADVFTMLCHNRWGGLEQEGFGIVFVEAAAVEVPQVAGRSGGSHEAVVHGETGLVIDEPRDVAAVAAALDELLADPDRRARLGAAGRRRVEAELTYDALAARLASVLA